MAKSSTKTDKKKDIKFDFIDGRQNSHTVVKRRRDLEAQYFSKKMDDNCINNAEFVLGLRHEASKKIAEDGSLVQILTNPEKRAEFSTSYKEQIEKGTADNLDAILNETFEIRKEDCITENYVFEVLATRNRIVKVNTEKSATGFAFADIASPFEKGDIIVFNGRAISYTKYEINGEEYCLIHSSYESSAIMVLKARSDETINKDEILN